MELIDIINQMLTESHNEHHDWLNKEHYSVVQGEHENAQRCAFKVIHLEGKIAALEELGKKLGFIQDEEPSESTAEDTQQPANVAQARQPQQPNSPFLGGEH